MSIEKKEFDFDIKADGGDGGTFTGYGSVFGNVDQGNETVAAGAFAESLKETAAKGRSVPILWQHRSGEPIGVYTSIKEDSHGLLMTGQLLVKDIARAREAHALIKAGAVTGLSIGYVVNADEVDQKTGVRTLKALSLKETSIVTFPMNDDARISAVKSMDLILKSGRMPTLPEFEELLREAGFSKSQATAVAGHGLRKLLDRREADGENSGAVLDALKSFNLRG